MWPRRTLGALAVSGATSACSLLVSTNGLVGEPRGDSQDSGASQVRADAATDGGTDGARVDGDTEAGAPFCPGRANAALFCADFDTVNAPDDGWTFHQSQGGTGGVFQIDRSVSVSSPASLLIGAGAGDPIPLGGLTNWLAYEPPKSNYTGIHFECQFRIEALDPMQKAYLAGVQLGPTYLGDFALVPGGRMYFVEGAATMELTPSPAVGTWVHLEIDFTGIPTRLTLKLDGAALITGRAVQGADLSQPQGRIGVRYYENGTVTSSAVHFDNVLLEPR